MAAGAVRKVDHEHSAALRRTALDYALGRMTLRLVMDTMGEESSLHERGTDVALPASAADGDPSCWGLAFSTSVKRENTEMRGRRRISEVLRIVDLVTLELLRTCGLRPRPVYAYVRRSPRRPIVNDRNGW